MNKNILKKGLVVGVIFLFIGVGINPAFAVKTKTSIVNNQSEEDCGCQVINDVNLVRFERLSNRIEKLLNMLEIYTNIVSILSKNNLVIAEKYEDSSNEIATLKESNEELKTDIIFQDSPFICDILEKFLNHTEEMGKKYCEKAQEAWEAGNEILASLYGFLCFLYFRIWSNIKIIGINLRCWDWL